MNNKIEALWWKAQIGYNHQNCDPEVLEKFAMLVIQDYEKDKREDRRNTMSELGYSRIGRNNI